MNVTKLDAATRKRRLLVRSLLVAVFMGLLVFAFLSGKGHTILVDNKATDDGSVKALTGALVTIDGFEELELYPNDRLLQKVKGQSHVVRITTLSDGAKVEKTLTLPLMTEMMVLSVPKLVAGKEPYLEVFVPKDLPPPADEAVGNVNSFTSPDAILGPDAVPLP